MRTAKAVIIGIDSYEHLNNLSGCVNDASEIKKLLEFHSDGKRNFEVQEFLSTINDLTRSCVKKGIDDLFKGDPDVALFYFAGHGSLTSFGGYIATSDSKKYDEGVSMDEILGAANKSSAKHRIVILDCCYSGNMGSPSNTDGEISGLKSGVTILTACRPNETAGEENGQGVFTALLLDALQGGAADLRGHISPGGIYAHIDQALGEFDQRPVFKTNVTRFTSLREVEPPIPINVLRSLGTFFDTPQDEFNLDPSYEDTNAETIEHDIIEPFAIEENVTEFKKLQKLQSVGLVKPVDEEYMYYAAMNSKSCKLTPLGIHYWNLAKKGKI